MSKSILHNGKVKNWCKFSQQGIGILYRWTEDHRQHTQNIYLLKLFDVAYMCDWIKLWMIKPVQNHLGTKIGLKTCLWRAHSCLLCMTMQNGCDTYYSTKWCQILVIHSLILSHHSPFTWNCVCQTLVFQALSSNILLLAFYQCTMSPFICH